MSDRRRGPQYYRSNGMVREEMYITSSDEASWSLLLGASKFSMHDMIVCYSAFLDLIVHCKRDKEQERNTDEH